MKQAAKQILTKLAKNDLFWKFISPLSSVTNFVSAIRSQNIQNTRKNNIENLFKISLVVQNGIFKGMKYPRIDSNGSSIYPKLLGSYELELAPFVKEAIATSYSEIIDVGCAEGYYAVGFALNTVNTKIYAYDTEEKARILCQEMSNLNGVQDKINIKATLTSSELKNFKFTGKGLVICDCEGFEKDLFNQDNINNLKNCDILIETHDLINIEISTYLKKLFAPTHDIEVIQSIDDIQKAIYYDFEEIKEYDLATRKHILAEGRGATMEWLICRAKG